MHNCTPEGLYGAIQAHAAIDDGPLFDHGNINNASLDAQVGFAKVMNTLALKQEARVDIGGYTKNDENLVAEAKSVW